ncbi:molybdopterin synthase catalytic subunit [Condylostylus longicornis]|uniref:molybdopterin synthase catalytic subunit n=1 Tax=Condylostylus longicornis TaxID=2530218 RepID=UPI00244E34F9|nr:molybdopterin synthase catalytic subunit [Condylostylus longicornis]
MNYIKLTEESLNVGEISDLVADSSCGAISLFVGTTRDNFEDKKVISLEYEAYDKMATKVMNEICDKIRTKLPDVKNIAIYHRLENVPVKEASVVIAVSSPHRQSSLEGVQFAIDELKKSVPIWKKEKYDGEESAWKENKECEITLKRKIRKINFNNDCKVIISNLPKHLIQINADDNEVQRRIKCFIDKKRQEIDINNILDFTTTNELAGKSENIEESCARLNAVLIKSKNCKGHLRVHRVKNEIGPQDPSNYTKTLDKLMGNLIPEVVVKQEIFDSITTNYNNTTPSGIEERIKNVENYLNTSTSYSKDVYERLKILEEKILYLESLSPEYRYFMVKNNDAPMQNLEDTVKQDKKKFSIEDIENYIDTIKTKINCKIKQETS